MAKRKAKKEGFTLVSKDEMCKRIQLEMAKDEKWEDVSFPLDGIKSDLRIFKDEISHGIKSLQVGEEYIFEGLLIFRRVEMKARKGSFKRKPVQKEFDRGSVSHSDLDERGLYDHEWTTDGGSKITVTFTEPFKKLTKIKY